MTNDYLKRSLFLLATGIVMGSLFSFQAKSVSKTNNIFNRESRVNIFREIQIAKQNNQSLREQVEVLKEEITADNDREAVLRGITQDINKYQMVLGEVEIRGDGIDITIDKDLSIIWFTDLINELNSAGAEAISINNYRITPFKDGFDLMPNGQILLGGDILSAPYNFKVVGDSDVLMSVLNQVGGILERIQSFQPDIKITVVEVQNLILPANRL